MFQYDYGALYFAPYCITDRSQLVRSARHIYIWRAERTTENSRWTEQRQTLVATNNV